MTFRWKQLDEVIIIVVFMNGGGILISIKQKIKNVFSNNFILLLISTISAVLMIGLVLVVLIFLINNSKTTYFELHNTFYPVMFAVIIINYIGEKIYKKFKSSQDSDLCLKLEKSLLWKIRKKINTVEIIVFISFLCLAFLIYLRH